MCSFVMRLVTTDERVSAVKSVNHTLKLIFKIVDNHHHGYALHHNNTSRYERFLFSWISKQCVILTVDKPDNRY